jgi:hypothetical protein
MAVTRSLAKIPLLSKTADGKRFGATRKDNDLGHCSPDFFDQEECFTGKA